MWWRTAPEPKEPKDLKDLPEKLQEQIREEKAQALLVGLFLGWSLYALRRTPRIRNNDWVTPGMDGTFIRGLVTR